MSMHTKNIKPGDRITYKRPDGAYKSRTVYNVGDNYVTVMYGGGEVKVPRHHITSVVNQDRIERRGKNLW